MQGHTVSEAESERIITITHRCPDSLASPHAGWCSWACLMGGWLDYVLSRWFWVWGGEGFGSLALRSSTMVDGVSFYLDRATFRRDSIHSVCADHRTIDNRCSPFNVIVFVLPLRFRGCSVITVRSGSRVDALNTQNM